MIEINNQDLFGKVIADALVAVDNNAALTSGMKMRWINAIGSGAAMIENTPEWLTWMPEAGHLLIWSNSNEIYEANGTCSCKAFMNGFPCRHRAAAKLLRNYFEALETKPSAPAGAAVPMEKAPYFQKTTAKAKPMSVGSIRV